jgi:predicted nucleotidyltransferase
MYTKDQILDKLVDHRDQLRQFGVRNIGLFGSVAKDHSSLKSDIDILIDFDQSQETYDNFIAVCDYLEQLFEGQKVDVVTKGGLSRHIGSYILDNVIYV